MQSDVAVGIDIGTSYCRVAVLDRDGQPVLVPDEYGDRHIPAVVRYTMHGAEVGYYPQRFLVTDWENSVREIPRYIGRWRDLPPDVLAASPCTVYEDGGRAIFNVLYRTVRPEEAYAALVEHLVRMAERFCGRQIGAVVLTVPANAEDRFRVVVREVVERLGIQVLAMISQPAAALLAFQHDRPQQASRLVAVADIGGGNTDVSIARLERGNVTIKSTAGQAYLGGVELQWRLAERLNEHFCRTAQVDLLAEQDGSRVRSLGLLDEAGEALKALTQRPSTPVVLDHLAGFGADLWMEVQRSDFERWIGQELGRIAALCGTALRRAGLQAGEIDQVIATGGASMIPAVRLTVALAFDRSTERLTPLDPFGAVACGAALQAGILLGRVAGNVREITPYPLGIGSFPRRGMPDDDTKMFSVIVNRHTAIPTPAAGTRGCLTQTYATRFPYQTEMSIEVLQYRGEQECAATDPRMGITADECEVLGAWTLTGIKPREESLVDVSFQIDRDGILHVTAREQGTRNILRQQIDRW